MNRISEHARAVPLLAAVLVVAATLRPSPVRALDAPILMREPDGPSVAPGQQGCPLEPNLTGDCANLRYYNLCSSYLWIYSSGPAAVGVRFDHPCISQGGVVQRTITYWRNVMPGYGNTVDVALWSDGDNNGCPEAQLVEDSDLDPSLRWNCSEFGYCIPTGLTALVVRAQTAGSFPTLVTDGARSQVCDPFGSDHSYYYGVGGEVCMPWRLLSPTGRGDEFLYWLILDAGCPTATRMTTWGTIKTLYR